MLYLDKGWKNYLKNKKLKNFKINMTRFVNAYTNQTQIYVTVRQITHIFIHYSDTKVSLSCVSFTPLSNYLAI